MKHKIMSLITTFQPYESTPIKTSFLHWSYSDLFYFPHILNSFQMLPLDYTRSNLQWLISLPTHTSFGLRRKMEEAHVVRGTEFDLHTDSAKGQVWTLVIRAVKQLFYWLYWCVAQMNDRAGEGPGDIFFPPCVLVYLLLITVWASAAEQYKFVFLRFSTKDFELYWFWFH